MLVARAARTLAPLRNAVRVQTRGVHIENKVGQNFPFGYTNKTKFTIGYCSVMTLGWSVGFIACAWQQWKVDHMS